MRSRARALRLGSIWALAVIAAIVGVTFSSIYGQRIVALQTAYSSTTLDPTTIENLAASAQNAYEFFALATPLFTAAALLALLALAVHSYGWQRRRAQAGTRTASDPASTDA